MIAMLGQHSGTVAWSVALHVAIFAALTLTLRWPSTHLTAVPAPIQGIMVDPSVLRQEQQRRDQEAQRKQRDERQKREAAEQQQREKEAADKRERDRVADQQRQKEQADHEKAEAVKVAQEKAAKDKAAAQDKAAQEKAAQDARDKQARDDAARKQKDALAAKQKAQAESDLQKELAAEAARQEAERSGVLDEYIRQIQARIELKWNPPLSAKPGLECIINVVQLPTGDVYDAKVDAGRCNGDEAVRLSIEKAVRDASPLPKPPSQAVFQRNLIVTFKPNL